MEKKYSHFWGVYWTPWTSGFQNSFLSDEWCFIFDGICRQQTYLPAYLPTCLPTYLPTYSPTYLPSYLPTYLQIVTKLKSSYCDQTKIVTKLKLWQNLKTQLVTKLKNSNCDKTQKLKVWQQQKQKIKLRLFKTKLYSVKTQKNQTLTKQKSQNAAKL